MQTESLKIDWDKFQDWFNKTLQLYGSTIPRIIYITKGKKAQAQRIVNELGSKRVLMDAAVNMAKSDFLNGRRCYKGKAFVASFPWLLESDERIADVANGRYDNPPEVKLTAAEKRQQAEAEREAVREQRRKEWQEAEQARIMEERRKRDEMYKNAVHGAELEEIFKNLNKQMSNFKRKEL